MPWVFIIRGWLSLNAKEVLTNTEADVLGTGGEICFFVAVSITPLITVTGARWFAPLRRWYGIFFALIGISDAATAAITTDFEGGVFGRLAGHTFLVTGFFVVLMAVPLLVTANTPAQRRLGRYWKRLQRFTYVLWALIVSHLLLLDDFVPFGGPQGDGDPVFHQRFYQAVAISLPLVVLRLPPVRRWITDTRAAGRAGEGVAGRGAAGRAVDPRLRLHHQRGDLHRNHGHHDASPGQLNLFVRQSPAESTWAVLERMKRFTNAPGLAGLAAVPADPGCSLGAQLTLSEATVKTHVGRILAKLQLRDRVQAVVLAYQTGLVGPGPS